MKILSYFGILALGLGLAPSYRAASAAEAPCPVSSAQDILHCALERDPDILVSVREAERDAKLSQIAGQRPNPTFETRILAGQTADDTLLNTEDTLRFNVELGGKRPARLAQAKAEAEKSSTGTLLQRETAALGTVLKLYRLRQIRDELARIHETLSEFEKILGNFRFRPKLTPEQEASKTTFELAKEDFRLKRTELIQEQATSSKTLELVTQVSEAEIRRYLPRPKLHWPTLDPKPPVAGPNNAPLLQAKADQALTEEKIRVAKSKAWPDLGIGPSFDTETSRQDTRLTGGIGLAIPLPLLNRNQGEISYAIADRARSEAQVEALRRKFATDRSLQILRYEAARQALRQTQSPSRLEVQHENIEGFYERGLVPSTLVIEAHRQWYETVRARHVQELSAVEALWRVYILDGKLEEAKI